MRSKQRRVLKSKAVSIGEKKCGQNLGTSKMENLGTDYSVVRSLSEAPNYAAVIANILKSSQINGMINRGRYTENILMQGGSKGKKKEIVIIVILIFSIGALVLGLSLIIYMLKKRTKGRKGGPLWITEQFQSKESQQEDLELPLIDLLAIEKATSYFSMNNILGEGGFGPVYKVAWKGKIAEGSWSPYKIFEDL